MFVPSLEAAASGLGWLKAAHSALLVCLIPRAALRFSTRAQALFEQASSDFKLFCISAALMASIEAQISAAFAADAPQTQFVKPTDSDAWGGETGKNEAHGREEARGPAVPRGRPLGPVDGRAHVLCP